MKMGKNIRCHIKSARDTHGPVPAQRRLQHMRDVVQENTKEKREQIFK